MDLEFTLNPEWLHVKSVRMVDDFIDVNEGEKELMKLWNLHLLTYYMGVSDCQLPLVCKRFVERRGPEVIKKNLFRNFCLHLTNLYDFGLLTCQGVHGIVKELKDTAQRLKNDKGEHATEVNQMGPPEQVAASDKKIAKNVHQVNLQLQHPMSAPTLSSDDNGASPVIAIDFGMTYSRVAVFHDNQVRIIKNLIGEEATLSYVTFNSDGTTVVGQGVTESKITIFALKRIIGRSLNDLIQHNNNNYYWPRFVQGEDGPMVEVHGRKLSLEMVLSFLFRELKTQAGIYLNMPVKKAVITIPSHYNDRQKLGTLEAVKLAGLELYSFLHEPIAAAITCTRENVKKLLVFDLGRHGLQLTILERKQSTGNFELVNAHEDRHLGSETFDTNTRNYCYQALCTKYGVDPFEGKDSINKKIRHEARCRFQRLQEQCHKARMDLSTQHSACINVGLISHDEDFSIQITRKEFEQINAQAFQRIIANMDNVLQSASLEKEEIDDILPVGGSTRMPKIQSILNEYFNGKTLNQSVPPECAVVFGAAIYAAAL